MPTGYTAGILEGTVKTFKEFAIKCSRAFIMHMRDEPMNAKYKARVPSDYHLENITEAEDNIKALAKLTDKALILEEQAELEEEIKDYKTRIEKVKADKVKLDDILKKAYEYKAPTDKHVGIRDFMVEQLKSTIDFDCGTDYYDKELAKLEKRNAEFNADEIRKERLASYEKDLAYHKKEHAQELVLCADHNKWYDDFIKSID